MGSPDTYHAVKSKWDFQNHMMNSPVSRSLFGCVVSLSPQVRTLPEFMTNTSISWKYNVFILVWQKRNSTACSGSALMPVTGFISAQQYGWTSCLSCRYCQDPRNWQGANIYPNFSPSQMNVWDCCEVWSS